MADEEIVIIEEEDAAGLESTLEDRYEESHHIQEGTHSNKKLFIIASVVGAMFLISLVILILNSDDEPRYTQNINISQEQTQLEQTKSMTSSELENMIKRANVLYEKGHKDDALKLFKKIANFSESISYYNLGVAQLQDKQYEKAISSFDLAIQSKQNMCVSAINAAVASLELGRTKDFESYINRAHSYLGIEAASPMYSYYYSLISYYQDNYLESLSPLSHRSSKEYEPAQNVLHAKINVLFSSYQEAINDLEKDFKEENALSLGLLYANTGNLTLSKKYLRIAILNEAHASKAQVALALIQLKSGQIQNAADLIDTTTDLYPEKVYTHYQIEVNLKKSLFDVNLAQKNFHANIIHNQATIYQILFYFAPFKIFNANQSISYIRKGNAHIYIDNISSASQNLNQSAKLSQVNENIAEAIQMALSFRLSEANVVLQKMSKIYPRHSIVHYNLALTYAQLGEMALAHKHFLQSYHLDAKNYLSGIFTMYTAKIINQENEKFNLILTETLALEPHDEEHDFYRALIHYKNSNFPATYHWLERAKKERPLYIVFDMLIAMSMQKEELAQKYAQKLTTMLPHDILPHLLYIDAFYSNEEQKMFARKANLHLKRQDFSMNDFYYGPFITKYLYTQYAQITGTLHPLRDQLKNKLRSEKHSPESIIESLALVDIFTKNFEESYTLYNQLIDQYKQQNAHTFFLASIAATGASHPANAIALLELSRRKSPYHNESRYALGLLYLQMHNNDGAVVSFKYMTTNDFKSQFFNFRIKDEEE